MKALKISLLISLQIIATAFLTGCAIANDTTKPRELSAEGQSAWESATIVSTYVLRLNGGAELTGRTKCLVRYLGLSKEGQWYIIEFTPEGGAPISEACKIGDFIGRDIFGKKGLELHDASPSEISLLKSSAL